MGIFDSGMALFTGKESGQDNVGEAANGAGNLAQGLAQDGFSSDKTWDGIHDLLHGGAGALGDKGGASPLGKVAKAFTFGMDIGDAIAPMIFGDKDEHGSKTEEVPADGVFKPSTGNKTIDAAVEGIGDAGKFVADLIPSKLPSLPSIKLPSFHLPSLF